MKLYHHIHKLSYRFNNISFNIRNLQLFSTNSNNLSNSNKKKENYAYGLELDRYGNIEQNRKLLEVSLLNGCESILIQSSKDCIEYYQVLSDLQQVYENDTTNTNTTNSIQWNQLCIGHLLPTISLQFPQTIETIQKEYLLICSHDIHKIKDNLHIKSITANKLFISIPSTLIIYEKKNEIVIDILYLKQLIDFIHLQYQQEIEYAIHFTTEVLYKMSIETMELIILQLEQSISFIKSSIKYILIATNVFTFHRSFQIQEFLLKYQMNIKSIETNRIHFRRPGNLGVNSLIAKELANITYSYTSSLMDIYESSSKDILHDISIHIQKCLHLENMYKEKFSHLNLVDMKLISWGYSVQHMIHLSNIILPEEWDYIRRIQIQEKYYQVMNILKNSEKDVREWAMLYSTISSYLFNVFEQALYIRKMRLLQDISNELCKDSNRQSDKYRNLFHQQYIHGIISPLLCHIINELGFHQVYISGMNVTPKVWKQKLQGLSEIKATKDDLEVISKIFVDYSNDDLHKITLN